MLQKRSWTRVTLSVTALAGLALSLSAVPSQAAPQYTVASSASAPVTAQAVSTKITQTFFLTTQKFNSDIDRCLFIHAYGTLKYTVTDYVTPQFTERKYTKFRSTPQQFQVYIKDKCKDGHAKKASGATLRQEWSHTICRLNPSIEVSYLDVAAGVSPECGDVTLGEAESAHDENASVYRQGNSDWRVKWSKSYSRILGTDDPVPCARAYFRATVHRGGDDGTIRLKKKICADH